MLVHGNAPTPDLHFRYGMPGFRSCLHWVVRLDHRRLKTGCALSRGVSKWPHSVLLSECSRQYGFLSCWTRRILARAIISGSWLKGSGSVRSPSGQAFSP
jgi:hypothetical protein